MGKPEMIPEHIIIEEQGRPKPTLVRAPNERIDSDWLIVAGIAFCEAGSAVIWWPSSLVLAGLFCFGYWLLLQRSKKVQAKK